MRLEARTIRVALLAATGLSVAMSVSAQVRYLEDWAVALDDRPEYAQPAYDDSDWPRSALFEIDADARFFWLRSTVELGEELAFRPRPLGVRFAGMATCAAFWDGEPLERFGRAGATAAEEVPGPISWTAFVPERLAGTGRHAIALRCSAHHRGFAPKYPLWHFLVGDYLLLEGLETRASWVALLSLSALVIIGLYCLLLYLTDRRERSFLLLALLCLTAAALLVAEAWRPLFGYTYDWHIVRLRVVTGLAWLVGVELIVFLVHRFPLPGRRLWVGLGIVAATVPLFVFDAWDPRSIFLLLGTFLLALLWVLRALARRMAGSVLATVGLSAGLALFLFDPNLIVDLTLYLALDVLFLCLLAEHALRLRTVRRERERALVRSARLESELLKRSLQPHFLMNTLTALAEWFEQEPRVAGEMLAALAEELRLLGEIADRRLIPVREELRLCRAHLTVMSRRKGRSYRLVTEGVDAEACLPPAVLHTLVENAITHHRGTVDPLDLRLSEERLDGRRRLRFEAPLGVAAAAEPGDSEGATEEVREGTGLRYVRARLEEAYGERWSLVSRRTTTCWQTEITVPAG